MSQPMYPAMYGISGLTLREDERAWIKEHKPFSFILFARSIESEAQVRALTAELAELSATSTPLIAVDQEGGRVQRLKFKGQLPPMGVYGAWYAHSPEQALEAAELHGFLLATQLREVGCTWVLAPCLDRALPETHAIIGTRALAESPEIIAALGAATQRGIRAGGALSCIKHAPGHGRTTQDTHEVLPTISAPHTLLEEDAAPFKALAPHSDFIMTAHINYPAWDDKNPATFSPTILNKMRTEWNFNGLILADDLGMHALTGPYMQRAERALNAGCDGVIAALSIVKQGMAGTVWDEENFKALQQGSLPPLNARASAYVNALRLLPTPTQTESAEKTSRFRALWATRPSGIDATVTV